MSINKYEQNLLQTSSRLDAATNCGGRITNCAKMVIENNTEAVRRLCRIIERISDLKDHSIISLAIETKDSLVKYCGYQQLKSICSVKEMEEDHLTLEELMFQLNQLVGLKNVKSKVYDLIAFHKVQILRKKTGLHSPKNTMHLAFTGNPGTGKTTVARIVGRMYKKLGLLSKGHFMEVSRTDLIAGYQGQTAHKVKDVIEKAKGGVLFIDEAYSITENDHSDSYGKECLTELTKALEDYRKDLVVIVAGYTEPMQQFFDSNPGLKSRFNTFIEFDDYSVDELMDIICYMGQNEDYIVTDGVRDSLRQLFMKEIESTNKGFANGRFVRNVFESMIMNHARRVVHMDSPTISDLKELIVRDVPI